MKRFYCSFIITFCFHVWVGLTDGAVYGDFGYQLINNDTEVRISRYDGNSSTPLEIPSHIEGKAVTEIGDFAFEDSFELTEVVIPEGVVRIGNWAFGNCYRMTSVQLPESLEEIGTRAFSGCGIENISLPMNLYAIGSTAFWECHSLESVFIPNSVENIGTAAFSNCDSLTSIEVDIGNLYYSSHNNALFNKSQTRILTYPSGQNGSYTIPDSVQRIDDFTFYNSDGLTSVNVPENTTHIGEWAFYSCDSLASLSPINGVESIGYQAFAGCSLLSTIQFSDNLLSVGTLALQGTNISLHTENNLQYLIGDTTAYLIDGTDAEGEISIPLYVMGRRVMSVNAFRNCDGLTRIKLPDGITSIGALAFQNCDNLTYLDIPDSVVSIETRAFAWCESLRNIDIPDGVTEIGAESFFSSGIKEVIIPPRVTKIGESAFSQCASLRSIIFEGDLPELEGSIFSSYIDFTTVYAYEDAVGFQATLDGKSVRTLMLDDDEDGDGSSNLHERIFGTNPLDNKSKFRVWIETSEDRIAVHFFPYRFITDYSCSWSSDLNEPLTQWSRLGSSLSVDKNHRYFDFDPLVKEGLSLDNIKAAFFTITGEETAQ